MGGRWEGRWEGRREGRRSARCPCEAPCMQQWKRRSLVLLHPSFSTSSPFPAHLPLPPAFSASSFLSSSGGDLDQCPRCQLCRRQLAGAPAHPPGNPSTHMHTLTHSLSLSHTHAHTFPQPTLSHAHPLSHTHTHTCTHTHAQATQFLVAGNKNKMSKADLEALCSALSIAQIYRLCTMYWDDK